MITLHIYILILFRPRTGFSRISSAYLVVSTSECYTCDQHQRANFKLGLGVLPYHTKISTKTATADKRNHLWPWNSLDTLIMVSAFSGCLCLITPSPVFGWREKSGPYRTSNTNSSHNFSANLTKLYRPFGRPKQCVIRWFSFTSVNAYQGFQVVFFANRHLMHTE